MNAPKPISVTVPSNMSATSVAKRLIVHGIPAHTITKYSKGGRLERHLSVAEGVLSMHSKTPPHLKGSNIYIWTPPVSTPSDAERFVILASLMSAIYEHQGEVVDPLHAVIRRLSFEKPPTAPAADYWRDLIDRAVSEVNSDKP